MHYGAINLEKAHSGVAFFFIFYIFHFFFHFLSLIYKNRFEQGYDGWNLSGGFRMRVDTLSCISPSSSGSSGGGT